MGDVGSAFLCFTFAAMPFLAARGSGAAASDFSVRDAFIAGGALVWLFFFDTVVTILRRIRRGENIWRAHRTHIYQRLVSNGFSHARTAVLYGGLSLTNAVLVRAFFQSKSFSIYFLNASLAFESIALAAIFYQTKKRNNAPPA